MPNGIHTVDLDVENPDPEKMFTKYAKYTWHPLYFVLKYIIHKVWVWTDYAKQTKYQLHTNSSQRMPIHISMQTNQNRIQMGVLKKTKYSEKRKSLEKNTCLILPPINPYQYCVYRQLLCNPYGILWQGRFPMKL